MDAVIAYVDGNDPLWQQDYRAANRQAALSKRYRDWGTLPFLLRGIQRHMPVIERVFLVGSRERQVPAEADGRAARVPASPATRPGRRAR